MRVDAEYWRTCGIALWLVVHYQCIYTARALPYSRGNIFRDHAASMRACDKPCETVDCVIQAGNLLSTMSQDVDPCDDFYKFACGNFIKQNAISDRLNIVNVFSIAQSKISNELYREILETGSDDLRPFRMIKTYYDNCMNEARIEEEGTKPVERILEKMAGWPIILGDRWNEAEFDWIDAVFKLSEENFLTFFPVIPSVIVDNKNSTKFMVNIRSAFTSISKFLLDEKDNKFLKAYSDFMQTVTLTFGAKNDSETMDELKRVLDFEIKLFNITTPEEELMDLSETGNRFTITELSKQFPSIPWLNLINKVFSATGVTVTQDDVVYVTDPKYVKKLEILLRDTPKRILANYLAWDVVQLTLLYMPDKLRSATLNLHTILTGAKESMNRESWCLNEIMESFSISLSAKYVKKYFNKQIRSSVIEIFENIRNQTKKDLKKNDWMDDVTKAAALEKIEAINVTIGHVDELMDDAKVDEYYRPLELNAGSYLKSALNITLFLTRQNYRFLREPVNKNIWMSSPNVALINAYNSLQKNSIDLPAGFLATFFKPDRPNYLNYGMVGTLIGHEIIHAFDHQGRKFDKNGNQNNWWQADTEEKFIQKTKCIIEQYSNFTVEDVGLKVNGIMTQGENIADNAGFKIAYHAYNDWTSRNNATEECLLFLKYTPKQMFWISAASNWCSSQRPEYLKDLIATNSHSPDNARVILSFSNIKEFSEDFNCKVGSKMNPVKKCVIW